MPGDISFTIEGADKLLARLSVLPEKAKTEIGEKALLRGALILESHIRAQKLAGQVLNRRTGRLATSITHEIRHEGSDSVARVGTNVIYARIHEFGGTVVAKSAKFLTIPLQAALTAAGVARYRARDLIASPSIGGFKRTFFRGKVLYGVTGSGKVKPVFALKRSVKIPERSFMRTALKDKAPEVIKEVYAALKRMLDAR